MSEDLRTEDFTDTDLWKPTSLLGPYKTEFRYWKRRWNKMKGKQEQEESGASRKVSLIYNKIIRLYD